MNVKEQARIDLADAVDAIEHLVELLPDMPLKHRVDVAARLRGAAKAIETIDKSVKADIKEQCGQEVGTVNGVIFKAKFSYVTVNRLNQTRLKDERPKLYNQYCDSTEEGRVNFEPR